MKVRNRELSGLLQGLKALDGLTDGSGRITTYFKHTSSFRMDLARNIRKVQAALDDYSQVRQRMVLSSHLTFEPNQVQGYVKPTMDESVKAQMEIMAFDAEEVKFEVPLKQIKHADLNLDKNDVPPSVLGLLMPIIEDEPQK